MSGPCFAPKGGGTGRSSPSALALPSGTGKFLESFELSTIVCLPVWAPGETVERFRGATPNQTHARPTRTVDPDFSHVNVDQGSQLTGPGARPVDVGLLILRNRPNHDDL